MLAILGGLLLLIAAMYILILTEYNPASRLHDKVIVVLLVLGVTVLTVGTVFEILRVIELLNS